MLPGVEASGNRAALQDVYGGFFPAIESKSCPHDGHRIRPQPVRSISAGEILYPQSRQGVLRSKVRGSMRRDRSIGIAPAYRIACGTARHSLRTRLRSLPCINASSFNRDNWMSKLSLKPNHAPVKAYYEAL